MERQLILKLMDIVSSKMQKTIVIRQCKVQPQNANILPDYFYPLRDEVGAGDYGVTSTVRLSVFPRFVPGADL